MEFSPKVPGNVLQEIQNNHPWFWGFICFQENCSKVAGKSQIFREYFPGNFPCEIFREYFPVKFSGNISLGNFPGKFSSKYFREFSGKFLEIYQKIYQEIKDFAATLLQFSWKQINPQNLRRLWSWSREFWFLTQITETCPQRVFSIQIQANKLN